MSLLKYESQLREPLVDGDKNYHQVTEDIIGPIETKPNQALVDRAFYCSWHFCFLVFIRFTGKWYMVLGNGILTTPLVGVGILPTSFGGLVLGMREHLFLRSFYCSGKDGEQV